MAFEISRDNKLRCKPAHKGEKSYCRSVSTSLVYIGCLLGGDLLSVWIFSLLP